MKIAIPVLNKSENALPQYSTDGAFAKDLRSNQNIIINRFDTVIVKTDLYMALPEEYALRIVPRSGLGSKGIIITNSPGTIDSDYRGNIGIIITNLSKEAFSISKGDRIAQCYLEKKIPFEFVSVNELDETDRGEGGFGSTGTK
jgi:dUTP pyrophosphatase